MARYIFDFGSDLPSHDDVTLCVEVPAESEQDARAALIGHLYERSGIEEPATCHSW